MIKTKKGFLLAEETLKIILAVIAIGFLAYLLFSIYNANQNEKYLEQAKASLDSLKGAIDAQQTSLEIYNPKGWFFTSWPHDYTSGFWFWKDTDLGARPGTCKNLDWENCICFCEKASPDGCDSKGVCFQDKNGFSFDEILVDEVPLELNIDYGAKTITKS